MAWSPPLQNGTGSLFAFSLRSARTRSSAMAGSRPRRVSRSWRSQTRPSVLVVQQQKLGCFPSDAKPLPHLDSLYAMYHPRPMPSPASSTIDLSQDWFAPEASNSPPSTTPRPQSDSMSARGSGRLSATAAHHVSVSVTSQLV